MLLKPIVQTLCFYPYVMHDSSTDSSKLCALLCALYEEAHLLVDLMTVTIIKSKCPIVKNLSVLLLGFVTFLLKIIEVHYKIPDQMGINREIQSLLFQKKEG